MTEYVEYRYSSPGHSHPDIAEAMLKLVGQKLPSGKICELGCGSGWLSHRLAERGYETLGVDLSVSGIQVAQSAEIEGVQFLHESIDAQLPKRIGLTAPFDLVVSNYVIEHLYRPADLLEAAKGMLAPGEFCLSPLPTMAISKTSL